MVIGIAALVMVLFEYGVVEDADRAKFVLWLAALVGLEELDPSAKIPPTELLEVGTLVTTGPGVLEVDPVMTAATEDTVLEGASTGLVIQRLGNGTLKTVVTIGGSTPKVL